MSPEQYIIGVDTGGTFTDCAIVDAEGKVYVGKAETTPQDLKIGVIEAVRDAASAIGITMQQLLGKARAFNQGTTIGTNILINRNGARTALITTKGFEDTIFIQRAIGRVDGLSAEEIRHQAICRKPEPLVPKELIFGVTERIDCFGKIVIPLNLKEVHQIIESLKAHKVEAVGVCLLWGFLNPEHEQKIREIVEKEAPGLYCQLASAVAPTIREYGRMNTVVIDTYVGPPMYEWYRDLKKELQDNGYKKEMLTMQVWGGVMPAKSMSAMGTINSGPAGGVIGSKLLANYLGLDNVVTTDVGGTSFDVSIVAGGRPIEAREPPIMRYRVSIPMIEIASIGAGGGSIAWLDPAGLLKVGPKSAGSVPGPACYDKGGSEPTVTDANLVLGYLNPDYFLGGKVKLNKELSVEAINQLGKRIGWDVTQTASAIFDIQNEHMSDLLRLVITRRGYDPREFSMFVFGGGGGTHAYYYGAPLGVRSIYMFPTSSVFSAFGIATSDIQRIFSSSARIRLADTDDDAAARLLTDSYRTLDAQAFQEMQDIGFKKEEVLITRDISMKFGRQVNMETIQMPYQDYTADDIHNMKTRFVEYYTRIYGEGAAFEAAGIEVMAQSVRATIKSSAKPLIRQELGPEDASRALKGERQVYFKDAGAYTPTKIYDAESIMPGNVIEGPAVIEAQTTTFLIPAPQVCVMNEFGHLVLDRV